MTNVRINKAKLIEILTKNRAEHREFFLEAQKVFRETVIKKLDEMLESARNNKNISLYVGLNPPQDYTSSYDTVLNMLNWSEDESIVLTHKEFKNYVEDDWDWNSNFAASNSSYIGVSGTSGSTGGIGSCGTSGLSEKFINKYKKYLEND